MNRHRRLIALLLWAGLVLFLLTTSAYIILEADHDCHGDGCDICDRIARLEALLRGMTYAGLLLLATAAAAALRSSLNGAVHRLCGFSATLVGLKVRLND